MSKDLDTALAKLNKTTPPKPAPAQVKKPRRRISSTLRYWCATVLLWLEEAWWWIRRSWEKTVALPKEVKWAWQRARRGYSDRDTWSFDDYLTGVIIGGLKEIQSRNLGWPAGMSSDDWDFTLQQMIEGFEEIRDMDKFKEDVNQKMWQALELFADNYFDLWD